MDAICGTVQVPIKSMPPVNRATGAPVLVVYNTSTVFSVDAAVPDVMVIIAIPDAMVAMVVAVDEDMPDMPDMVEVDPEEPLLERAHPIKLGMVTLTLLHSCMSNARASVSMLGYGTDL